ncbi:MAG: hypothetical protein OXG35_07650 [Acidobacteria bacterium]|nr:hypothetical protein [Acidobacteriota bacterium]
MSTAVARRNGLYPVRISLNVSEHTSELLDYLQTVTGESRGVLVREALVEGLPSLERRWLTRKGQAVDEVPSSSGVFPQGLF